jgi:23S rRNA (guanosine2251-2'-O)-methyltransferase
MLRGGKGLEAIRASAGSVPIEECDRGRLDRLADGVTHQGIVLEAGPLPVRTPKDWLAAETAADAIAVILDGVEDPHNFGAIVRSAAAFGARGVVFAKDRSAPLSTAAVKSAAGAMEYVDLIEAANLVRAVEEMKLAGFWIAALDAKAPRTLWEIDLKGRVGIVVGSEGKGVRRLVRERCDYHLRIPLGGAISSLNASVSAAIALAECIRQRC